MELEEPISVRAMKGKFEQMAPPDSSHSPSRQRRRRTPFSAIDPSPNEDILPPQCENKRVNKLLDRIRFKNNVEFEEEALNNKPNYDHPTTGYLEENRKIYLETETEAESRHRSLSVGSILGVPRPNHEKRPQLSSQKQLNRNQSLNDPHRKVKVKRNEEPLWPICDNNNYSNFSSFSEKQRLVENIVMNIRNSRNGNKENATTLSKTNGTTKENNITSKLEKDIKNVIERGVRKLGAKNCAKENKYFLNERPVADTNWAYKSKHEESTNHFTPVNNQRRSFSKINAILGEYVYPAKYDNKIKENKHNKMEEEVDNRPVNSAAKEDGVKHTTMRLKANNLEASHCEEDDHHFENDKEFDTKCESNQATESISPLRPPRKRSPRKKGQAPLPPSPLDKNISISEDALSPSLVNDKVYEWRSSSQSLENRCRIDHDRNASIDSENIDISNNGRLGSPDKSLEERETSNLDLCRKSPLLETLPPPKPPRTFAHDIYQSLKDTNELEEPEFSGLNECDKPRKLTPEELDSLYTKPLKKYKLKKSDISPPTTNPNEARALPPKPAIAPKPIDIIARAKQRYSVVEPLSSFPTKEFADHRPTVKRNSSFRFSFRKSKKTSVSRPIRPLAVKNESPVGRKFKQVTKHWQQKRHDSDRRTKFRPRSRSDEIIYNGEDDERIYAVPTTTRPVATTKAPELHYMCSPLFVDNRTETNLNTLQREHSPDRSRESDSEDSANMKGRTFQRNFKGKFGLMDGLRQEWRQSYRFVQKRLKGLPPSIRKL